MKVLTNNQYYSDIADTIRQMKGVATTYKPREMAGALRDTYSTEVEGVPPLTFPSNGNNLLNYRIDGANGGVGDRTANLLDYNWLFDYEQKRVNDYFNYIQITLEPNTTYNVTSDYDYNQAQNSTAFIVVNSNTAITTANGGVFGSLTVTTTQDGILKIARRIKGTNETMIPKREDFENNSKHIQISINSVNDDNYEPYGYKIPAIISGKNLANSNEMIQGYWAYADGTYIRTNTWICTPKIACKGNVDYTFQFANNSRWYGFVWYGENGNYISTSNVQNDSSTPYRTYTATSPSNARYLIINIAGYPGTNDTIRTDDLINFQLEEGSTPTDYEPYIEPTTTNIYLDEPIEANESKELSDTNVNIPTINGTNILSVNTTVQPSKVYVQAPKTNSGGSDEYFKNVTLPVQNLNYSWSTILKKIPEDITITIQGNSIRALFIYYYGEELPYFDTSNVTTFTECFMNCSFIEECPNYNTSKGLLMGGMFNNCINLKTAPNLDFSKAINVQSLFYNCTSLENIPIYNFKNVGQYSCSQVFYNCTSLTNQSLYNILETLNTVTITNQTYLKLEHWGLSETQATTCTTLSNWQALVNKGWTTGY